jgi:hypothetical protein
LRISWDTYRSGDAAAPSISGRAANGRTLVIHQ